MSVTLSIHDSVQSAYPKADYLVSMRRWKLEPTKNNQGTRFCMWFDILDGAYKGQTLYLEENYDNLNEVAQEIGRRRIGSVALATGLKLGDNINPDKMIGKKIILTAGLSEQEGYDDKNFVMSAKPAGGAVNKSVTKPGAKPTTNKPAPNHVANEETSQEMPDEEIEETQTEETPSKKSKPAYMNPSAKKPAPGKKAPPPKPKAKPEVAEILDPEHETLGEPEEGEDEYFYAVDSATGRTYRYDEDGMYHLVPEE